MNIYVTLQNRNYNNFYSFVKALLDHRDPDNKKTKTINNKKRNLGKNYSNLPKLM